jgi:flagellar hook protein FlgE
MSTFSNALSGLSANAQAIDVVSGNLANLNTYGYKANTVSFQDLVNQNLGGASGAQFGGSTAARQTRSFTQGSLQTTGGSYDAAIQGSGFFVVSNSQGQTAFTRTGNFKVDSSGRLLTQDNEFVQGWVAQNGVLNTSGSATDIALPVVGLRQPTPTTSFTVSANLNANAAVGTPDATFSSPIPVVDSQGTTHTATITYTKTAAGSWSYDVSLPSADLNSGTGTSTSVANGTISFDSAGRLLTPAATDGPITIGITGLADGAADVSLKWNLYDSTGTPTLTQFDTASANLGSTQDGSPSGQLTDLSIGEGGVITAHYSNGDNVAVAQLALASVLNPDSMVELGNNTYGVTSATALPAVGLPGTGTRGQIYGGSLETSTVDVAKEFTNLLTYERGYQANSKVITTEDEVLQATLAIKQ